MIGIIWAWKANTSFYLQFRLHRDDEEDYIVRSNGAYYMTRSVSTELDLEAGDYTVLLKIKATRFPRPDPEEAIRGACTTRREKLLSTGLSYDLAHAKGQFREREKEKQRQLLEQKKEQRKDEWKHAYERRKRIQKKAKLRQKKKELKHAERRLEGHRRHDPAAHAERDHPRSGLGIEGDTQGSSREDDFKPVHPAVAMHQKAASTGTMPVDPLRERSASPSQGFGGRGGYNRGRDGYNASIPDAYQGRGGYNVPADANRRDGASFSPDLNQGRGGYNMPMDSKGRDTSFLPEAYQGRGGYNAPSSSPDAYQGARRVQQPPRRVQRPRRIQRPDELAHAHACIANPQH